MDTVSHVKQVNHTLHPHLIGGIAEHAVAHDAHLERLEQALNKWTSLNTHTLLHHASEAGCEHGALKHFIERHIKTDIDDALNGDKPTHVVDEIIAMVESIMRLKHHIHTITTQKK